ncbi:MAG TPA: hypothetical protein VGK80_12955 [Rhodanobacteraceae bacterium]
MAKIVFAALLLSFFIGNPALLRDVAGTLLQIPPCVGVLVYSRVAR